MPKRKRASNRNRQSQPPTAQTPAAAPPSPPVVHELKANDYFLGEWDLPKPKLTQWWPEENFTAWQKISLQISHHFAVEEAKTGHRAKKEDAVAYIMKCKDPRGSDISERMAEALFTMYREGADMKGGRPPGKKNG